MTNMVAFVFPGQGSQSVGMLAELAAAHSTVRATFEEASDGAHVDLWKLSQEGPEQDLNQTANTQPALVAASVAIWRLWHELGGTAPAIMAGHSLGEYSALVCAGVLSLHDAAGLVAERGRLMQQAVPAGVGSMAAVLGADDALVAKVCADVAGDQIVAPANYNSPGQIVIAGHAEAVDRALAELAAQGVKKTVKLAVSVPSHTALMTGAAERLAQVMQGIAWHQPAVPVVQNVDAAVASDLAGIRDALTRQLSMPVQWTRCVQHLVETGCTMQLECGPGKVLTRLAKRIDRSFKGLSLDTPAALDEALQACAA